MVCCGSSATMFILLCACSISLDGWWICLITAGAMQNYPICCTIVITSENNEAGYFNIVLNCWMISYSKNHAVTSLGLNAAVVVYIRNLSCILVLLQRTTLCPLQTTLFLLSLLRRFFHTWVIPISHKNCLHWIRASEFLIHHSAAISKPSRCMLGRSQAEQDGITNTHHRETFHLYIMQKLFSCCQCGMWPWQIEGEWLSKNEHENAIER